MVEGQAGNSSGPRFMMLAEWFVGGPCCFLLWAGCASPTFPACLDSLMCSHLNLQTKPVDPTVDGGAQVQQVVNIECISDFTEAPVLNIQFR